MADIEKAIEGLEHCRLMTSNITFNPCYECPYKGNYSCADILKTDALELLKEQAKRIETLEKVNSINLNPKWPYVFNNYRKVVLCKDCRWWHESKLEQFKGFGECGQANGIALKPHDWFCADGECKDE